MIRLATGVRLVAVFAAFAAAPALAQSSVSSEQPSEESSVPDDLQGMVGDWTLEQEDENLPTCPITLTDQQSAGGWAVVLPEACAAPYPAATSLLVWNVDPADGSILLMDGGQHVTLHLFEDEDGLFDTDPNTPPRFYLLPPEDADGTGGEGDAD